MPPIIRADAPSSTDSSSPFSWTDAAYKASLIKAASQYYELGIVPVPVRYYPKHGQIEAAPCRGYLDYAYSKPNWYQVYDRFQSSTFHAIGVVVGQTGLVWLDSDCQTFTRCWLEQTCARDRMLPRYTTSPGKMHVIAKLDHPLLKTVNFRGVGMDVEIRAGNSLVIVAPSIHRKTGQRMFFDSHLPTSLARIPAIPIKDLLKSQYLTKTIHRSLVRQQREPGCCIGDAVAKRGVRASRGYNGWGFGSDRTKVSEDISAAISATLPERTGERFAKLPKYVRAMHRIRAEWSPDQIESAGNAWFESARASGCIRETSPEKTVLAIKDLFSKFDPNMSGSFLGDVANFIKTISDKRVSYVNNLFQTRALARARSVCKVHLAASIASDGKAYYLSFADMERILRFNRRAISDYSRKLERFGIIRCLYRGEAKRGSLASEYCYQGVKKHVETADGEIQVTRPT